MVAELVDEPGRLVVVEPAVVDPPTLPERFPEVPAAPGVPADAVVKMKSEPLPVMHPIIVMGALIEPVVV